MKCMDLGNSKVEYRGVQEKRYLSKGNLFLKYDLKNFKEGLSEVVTDLIINNMTANDKAIPHVHYFLKEVDGKRVCCCESFLKDNEKELPWDDLLLEYDEFSPNNTDLSCLEKINLMLDLFNNYMPRDILEEYFAVNTIIDWFCVDIDRHIGNNSFIVNNITGTRLAPRYDNGAAFRCKLEDIEFRLRHHFPATFGTDQAYFATLIEPIVVFDYTSFNYEFSKLFEKICLFYSVEDVKLIYDKIELAVKVLPQLYCKFIIK